MNRASDIDAIRQRAILSSLAGFPFLLVFTAAWLVAASLSYAVPRDVAPWLCVVLGIPAMPIAIILDQRLGHVSAPKPDLLPSLTLQVLFVQIVAFPAILLVWDVAPHYVPVAFAAVVGAHYPPFQWIFRTRLHGVVGVAVALGPFVLALLIGQQAMHYTGCFVGVVLLVGALAARAHARATWIEAGQAT